MLWQTSRATLDLGRAGRIMGVLNVTPDSFSDGGLFFQPEQAIRRGQELIREGADLIDVGGESTRPGAESVDAEEEIRRVIPVIRALAVGRKTLVSIDTSKAAVAAAAFAAGASVLNDVTALRGDPAMARVAREAGAGIVLMHMLGDPRTMQRDPHYADVVGEVAEFFRQRQRACVESGIPADRLIFDPGIGFGKTVQHNLTLLDQLPALAPEGRPLLVGVSRKSFLGTVLGERPVEGRAWATVALTSFLRESGARVFRVHDVAANLQALRMTEAMLHP